MTKQLVENFNDFIHQQKHLGNDQLMTEHAAGLWHIRPS